MYDKSQLMKGTLEGCILQILSETVTYGYEIVTTLEEFGFEDVKEGSIYPLLVRLEKKGMISSELRSSPLGPKRKYYSLTDEGQAYLKEFIKCWTEVQSSVNRILKNISSTKQNQVCDRYVLCLLFKVYTKLQRHICHFSYLSFYVFNLRVNAPLWPPYDVLHHP